ncbi:MAG: hypothetical protein COA97_09910 [Flavobacteriales bacterium]|nr:MAG: hypothetical protein COA97_09910 [Flavobacteriales bacterium]
MESDNRYITWKTNILNEAILIKTGLFGFYPGQQNEDAFNTEAHISGQYESGKMRDGIKDLRPNYTWRNVSTKDGILFFGFRLPTEKEWLYASQDKFKALKKKKTKSKYSNNDFGKKYYLFDWANYLSRTKNNDSIFNHHKLTVAYFKQVNQFNKNNPHLTYNCIRNYHAKYGIINMENGVKEWLLDEFSDKVTDSNFISLMRNSGFNVDLAAYQYLDEQEYSEKTSRGNLTASPYLYEKGDLTSSVSLRFMGLDKNGNPYEVSSLPVDGKTRKRTIRGGTNCNNGLQRSSMKETNFSPNVGFRVVLMYSGIPVLKGYKIKWK